MCHMYLTDTINAADNLPHLLLHLFSLYNLFFFIIISFFILDMSH